MNSVIEPLFVTEFDHIKDKDERILWVEKPKFVPYMSVGFGMILSLIAFSVIWVVFSLNVLTEGKSSNRIFLLFGLLPIAQALFVLGKKLLSFKKTLYAYSNKRIMIRSGIFSDNYQVINHDKIIDMEVKANLVEKRYGVGSILFFSGKTKSDEGTEHKVYDRWNAIPEPYEVFKKVKEHYR